MEPRSGFRSTAILALAVFMALMDAAASSDPGQTVNADVSGTWFIAGKSRRSRGELHLEIRIADDQFRGGTLIFPDSNITGTFERSAVAGRDFMITCAYLQGGENRTIELRGSVTEDMWVGRYRIYSANGERVTGGRFTGRKVGAANRVAENSRPDFPCVWLGHYDVYGERFRVRFDVRDGEGRIGTVNMPDEAIQAKITGCKISGDTLTLSAAWDIPESNTAAKVDFAGKLDGDRWFGEYTVFAAGKAQPLAKGTFHARQPPERGFSNRDRAGISSILTQPPAPNGYLAGAWQGVYKHAGKDFGLSVDVRVSEEKYIGAILLPDDRLQATVFYASDVGGQAQVIGLGEALDDHGDADALTINMIGEIRGNAWSGICTMNSDSARLECDFYLTRR